MNKSFAQQDKNFEVKKRYLVAFTYFLVCTAFAYVLYYLFYLHSYIGALCCLFGIISGLLVLKYGMPRWPYPIVGNMLIAIYSIVLVNNSLFTGGDSSASYWWMSSIPLVSSFLLRKEDTMFWTLATSVIMITWFFIPNRVWSSWMLLNPDDLENYHMVGAVTLNILIGSLAFMADYIREKVVNENDQLKISALQSAKMSSLGEMAGNIAHEINNPLSIISGNSSILRKKLLKLNATEEELKHLDRIN
ncbi:MAG: hypothetical protein Fur0010_05980 [Bdellovibrio sp.]